MHGAALLFCAGVDVDNKYYTLKLLPGNVDDHIIMTICWQQILAANLMTIVIYSRSIELIQIISFLLNLQKSNEVNMT